MEIDSKAANRAKLNASQQGAARERSNQENVTQQQYREIQAAILLHIQTAATNAKYHDEGESAKRLIELRGAIWSRKRVVCGHDDDGGGAVSDMTTASVKSLQASGDGGMNLMMGGYGMHIPSDTPAAPVCPRPPSPRPALGQLRKA